MSVSSLPPCAPHADNTGRCNDNGQPRAELAASSPSASERMADSVPPASLLPQEPDTRDRTTAEYLFWEQKLAADVAQRGILNPLHVQHTPAGDRVKTGETRRRVALLLALPRVPIIRHLRPMTEGEIALEQYLDDELRRPLSNLERADKWLKLQRLNGWNQAQLAQAVRKTPSAVSKVLAPFEAFPEDLRGLIGTELCITGAAAIARLGSPEAIREGVEYARSWNLKRDAIVAFVNARLGKQNAARSKDVLKLHLEGMVLTMPEPTSAKIQARIDRLTSALKKIDRDFGGDCGMLASLLK